MSVINKVVHIILTFVGRQIFLQILTVEYLGINGLFGNILNMLSLADLGIATAMSFSFYKPLADNDVDKLAALVGFYRKVYNTIAAFVAVTGLALTPFLGYIVNLETDIPYIRVYYLIALANTVISYLFVYKATIITADQNKRVVTRYSMTMSILGLFLQLIILVTTRSFMLYSLVSIFTTLTNNLLISKKAAKLYPFIKQKVELQPDDRKAIFTNIKSMFIFKISSVIFQGTDNIFISILVSTAMVGRYENYRLPVSNLSSFALIVFASLTPSIGNLVVKEPPEKRMKVFKVMQTVSYWIGGFFVFCLYFLIDEFVVLWLGADFSFDFFTKTAILLDFYLLITLYPIYAFREATGIYQKTKYAMVAAAALKIILSILLGMRFGVAGLLLATTVSKLLTYAWYEPKLLFRDFLGGSAVSYLTGHLLNFAMLLAGIALFELFLPWKGGAGWLIWIVKGVVYSIIINAVYFLRFFKTPEFNDVIQKAKSLLKRA